MWLPFSVFRSHAPLGCSAKIVAGMIQAHKIGFEPKVLVDYMSPDGRRVVGVKALVLQNRITYLEKAGYLAEYLKHLPEQHHEPLVRGLATSWVPSESVLAHYAALDALCFTDAQLAGMTESLAPTLYQTVFAALLRITRATVDAGPWGGLNQSARVASRIYQGGGLTVTQVGPKDALHEHTGMPFADSHTFRHAHCTFIRGVISMSTKACIVRDVPLRVPRTERYVVSISWV
jgi:hypothetical protein